MPTKLSNFLWSANSKMFSAHSQQFRILLALGSFNGFFAVFPSTGTADTHMVDLWTILPSLSYRRKLFLCLGCGLPLHPLSWSMHIWQQNMWNLPYDSPPSGATMSHLYFLFLKTDCCCTTELTIRFLFYTWNKFVTLILNT